ncbi:hypothetical protein Cme02nite_23840 [Catellatospora methionotrophica]|uniref:Exo-alpha-sialidase n=1 Tax=Catellatospora methionotrophica TaxID=121620 RepID=A0A8J3L3V5_9ACTN|nr:hypothetical protein [Catellatospora methionotrophica]GIG14052.1 hypothetical protein Cme02nite_23840 [Catellatospora methionotrophica]
MNRFAGRARPLLVLTLGLALAAACTPRGETPAGPSGAAAPSATASPPARATVTERTADVGVPPDYHPFVEFADARHGYAVFTDCGGSGPCRGRLFATEDAGKTWQARPMPLAEDKSIQLYVVGPKQMMIWGEQADGYHLSRDGGLTFAFSRTIPADYHAATGVRYGVDYTATEPVLRDWQTGEPVPLPDGYQGAGAVATPDGAIWLTTLEPRKETARSVDGGRTWQRLPVPDQPGRKLWMLSVRVSPTGDAWLVGEQDMMSAGGGTSLLRGSVLKATGLPLIWQLVDGAWRPRPIEGLREKPNQQYTVAPAGAGLLAVAGPDAVGYLADRYVEIPGTPRLDWVTELPDGTLFARQDQYGEFYLGSGRGWQRAWVKVTLR